MGAQESQANHNITTEDDGAESFRESHVEVSFDLPAIGKSQMAKDSKRKITGSGHKTKEP